MKNDPESLPRSGVRHDQKQVLEGFRSRHGDRYDYSRVLYVNKDTLVEIMCPDHGSFMQSPHSHKRGRGCPGCKGGVRSDRESFVKKARDQHGDRYDYSRVVYKTNHDPVVIVCSLHGEFAQTPNNHLGRQKSGCPECGKLRAGSTRRRSSDAMVDRLRMVHGDQIAYDNVIYTGYHGKIILNCAEHGRFEKTYWNALHQGCPRCSEKDFAKTSRGEKEVLAYIASFYPDRIESNCRTALGEYQDKRNAPELDIYLPDVNIAIEYCGLRYHSEQFGGKTRFYHRNKLELCEAHGIRLITLFEDEWIHQNEIVKARLNNLLKQNRRKLNARSCEVREVTSAETTPFLTQHHIQGPGRSSIKLGLFYEDELVSVMTFGSGNIAKGGKYEKDEFELDRFASSLNVRGAAGKLFKAFHRLHAPTKIFSFSDLRWNTGTVYKQIGMHKVSRTPPNYWYIARQKRLHRFSLRKNEGDDPALTEWENRVAQGWDRIWDCGSERFEWSSRG